jgi:hypothetical protein
MTIVNAEEEKLVFSADTPDHVKQMLLANRLLPIGYIVPSTIGYGYNKKFYAINNTMCSQGDVTE